MGAAAAPRLMECLGEKEGLVEPELSKADRPPGDNLGLHAAEMEMEHVAVD